MNRKKTAVVAFIGTVLLGLMLSAPAFAADRIEDADITYWVKSALRQDERVDASRITVATSDGIVTLSGDVDDLRTRGILSWLSRKTAHTGLRGRLADAWRAL